MIAFYLAHAACSFVVFSISTALSLPPDLSSAIAQSAQVLNDTSITVQPIDGINRNSNQSNRDPATSDLALATNETLLKNTKVYCNRQLYGNVEYYTCLDALSEIVVRSGQVVTFGERGTGHFIVGLPYRVLSGRCV